MVEEMRKMISASWIVNIKSGRGFVGAMQDLWDLILLQSVTGPGRELLWLQTQVDEAHIYFISYLVQAGRVLRDT